MASALSPEYKLNQSNQQQISETQQQQYDSSRDSTVNGIEVEQAQEQFEALARQLSKSSSAHRAAIGEKDVEAGSEDEFDLREYLQSNAAASDDAGIKHKKVGVTFENLTVLGADSVELNIRTFQDALLGNVLWLPMKIASLFGVGKPGSRKLLDDFTGCVKPGEMVLVLGRPGSGCSTFLKTISNQRVGFLGVDGDVSYAGLSAEEFQKRFKGEVVYNQEDDLHFPTLTVKNTLDFALKLKSPGKLLPEQTKETFVDEVRTMLLKMLNISHTENTLVGNEFVRGVSGGERKRVSIAEMLVSRACVLAWDNASRGLDASTALDYAKSIRLLTNIGQTVSLVSLYQAGEGIYNQFDKVLLIDNGKMAYFGPAFEARQYFINLGFLDLPRQTSGDWLCGITDPNLAAESRFQPGRDASNVPSTPESLAEAYRNSEIRQRMIKEMEDYKAQLAKDRSIEEEFRAAVREDKHKGVSKKSVYTVSFARQVQVLFTRQMQITWGNKFDIIMSYLTTIVLAIVVGSTFLKLPETAAGAFTRGGLLFISVLFNALTAFSELPTQMSGRPILFKQKSFAFFRPAAIGLANVLSEIPFSLPRIFIFGVIVYFMGGLALNAGNFFAFFINIYFSFLAMTSLFRIFGTVCANFNVAARLAAFIITALVLFAGYVIPRDAMARWLFWISYINPLYYGFGALMINEFRSISLECVSISKLAMLSVLVGAYITPRNVDGTLTQYPANVGPNQVCTLRGAEPGAQFVDGMAYLRASFGYGKVSDQWLYFGVVLIFFLGLTILTMGVTEIWNHGAFSSSLTIVKKPNAEEKKLNEALQQRKERRNNNEKEEESNLKVNACNYTWSNLNYTVPVKGGERRLLHDVFGYCKPGTLTALMGSSGAGKTTLLDVLADRKSVGIIEGDRLVNGRTFGKEFQRGCGYAEQMDIHEGTATLREALRFSAYLRQPASVPKEEKDAWVEEIISLLELEDLADAMIGVPEFGLGVGDRKRATIGVELAAKPDLLLFLDEPTSGLDGQTAYNVVRFLKKLANAGQAIMVTVHQPSSLLFEMMDRLLLLERGGETVYFGPIGKDSKHLVDYFAEHGAHCPSDVNPAEYMLEAIGAGSTKRVGDKPWSQVYRESELFQENLREIERINQEALAIPEDNGEKREYATSWFFQLQTVLKRTILSSWRNADYQFTRLFQHAVIALLTGLLFLQLDNSLSSVQYRVFGVFMMVVLPALILAQIQPFYIQARSIFTREDSSKMYGGVIFAISELLSEVPYSAACSVVYFLLFYYVVGFNSDSNRAGYFFAMLFVSEIFSVTFGQAVSAMSPSVYIAALTNPFFLVIFNLFCGVTIPKPNIPGVWRSWLYYVNPFTHLISGVVTNELYGLVVECRPEEFAVFQPPQGSNGQPMTCSEWADPFVNAVQAGYINNPNATSDCQYCQYRTGEDFYLPLDIKFSERGREIGIMIAFCAANTLILLAAANWIKYANR